MCALIGLVAVNQWEITTCMTVFCFNLCTQWFAYRVFGLCIDMFTGAYYLWYYLTFTVLCSWLLYPIHIVVYYTVHWGSGCKWFPWQLESWMYHAWNMHGAYMAYARYGHGLCTLHAWVMHVTGMGYACYRHGLCMLQAWVMHVTGMGYACYRHGLCMLQAWVMHVTGMGYACYRHGLCMLQAWVMHVTGMGYACYRHGLCMLQAWVMHVTGMGYACYRHGLCMLQAWVMHVTCMGYACYVHGNPDIANHAGNMHDNVTCMVYYACFLHATCMKKGPIFGVFQVSMFKGTCMVHACSYPLPSISKDTFRYIPCMEFHAWYCLLRTGNMHVSGAPFWVGYISIYGVRYAQVCNYHARDVSCTCTTHNTTGTKCPQRSRLILPRNHVHCWMPQEFARA